MNAHIRRHLWIAYHKSLNDIFQYNKTYIIHL